MNLKNQLKEYIKELMGLEIIISDWLKINKLPIFMKKKYEIYSAELMGCKFLLMISKDDNEASLLNIKKHVKQLEKYDEENQDVVFVTSRMSNYGRSSFIKENISFVVIGLQLYVPFLGIAFRERMKTEHSRSNKYAEKALVKKIHEKLTPTAQALFFELVTRGTVKRTQRDIAEYIGISKIAASRGFSILEEIGILEKKKVGVKNIHSFMYKGINLWRAIENYMVNPVEKVIYIDEKSINDFDEGVICASGETALSEVSMIASPRTNVYAMYKVDWDKLTKKPHILPSLASNTVKIELWSHPVPRFGSKIHPIALYLDLKGTNDERLLTFLDELLEYYFWDSIISTENGIEVLK